MINTLQTLRRLIERILVRVNNHRLSLVAAGMAFYAILSIFPALTAIISIYGLVADPSNVARQVAMLPTNVPPALLNMIEHQVRSISSSSGAALSIGLVISVGLAVYSASKSTRALVAALNIAYDEIDNRGILRLYAHTFLLTLGGVFLVIGLLGLIGLSGYLNVADIGFYPALALSVLRWLVVLVLMTSTLGVVYAFAPYRRPPRWRWLTPGAIVATLAWMLVSFAFGFYIGHFGSYNKVYGSAAAIVVLMLWFGMSAFVVLVGAEVNAEIESTAARTSGKTTPLHVMGLRSDNVGSDADGRST